MSSSAGPVCSSEPPSECSTLCSNSGQVTMISLRIGPNLQAIQSSLLGHGTHKEGMMLRRLGPIALTAAAVVLAVVSAASARPAARAATAASCSGGVQIGMLAPITGPAGSIGSDQLHWAQFYFGQWNKTHKLKITLKQFDDQLDPAKAATGAQSFADNSKIMGGIGPAVSGQVIAAAPILKKAGLAFASGSATRVSLTSGAWKGYFFRDVPNDGVQGPTDANYMTSKLGVKSGDSVMIVDAQEAYSTGLAAIAGQPLAGKGGKTT